MGKEPQAANTVPTQKSRNGKLDPMQRALEAIEMIVGDDFCEELDMANMHRKLRGRIATAHKKLSTIYMIAHAEVSSRSCHRVHIDWRKIKDQILNEENK